MYINAKMDSYKEEWYQK